jgi:CheY-like chemotaxis protein
MEAVGQLTGGIAHDFNNLLTVIVGNLDLLERHVPGEAGRRLILAARHGAERGARLTHSLLAFARRQQLRPEIVNPNQLIKEFRDLLRRAAGDAIELQLMLSPTVYPCRLDAAQFQSALLNLVVNARDAIATTGKITVETASLSIGRADREKYGDLEPGNYVVVAVSDTGVGMDQLTLARAFEPFFTTKDVGRGSGLGLSQVYGFVKQSGGHVQLASEPGVGTTVRLYLPQARATVAPEAAARTGEGPAAGGHETILVVEDDVDVCAVVAETLRTLGYRVITAPDGATAMAVLKSDEKVDLVFSDIVMPDGLSGDELGRWVATERRGVRVLLTSGYPDVALEQPAEGFTLLQKPYQKEDLARSVREALDR